MIVLAACAYSLAQDRPKPARRPTFHPFNMPEAPAIKPRDNPDPKDAAEAVAEKSVFKSDKEVAFEDVVN